MRVLVTQNIDMRATPFAVYGATVPQSREPPDGDRS